MKATELMISDWVETSQGDRQITTIGKYIATFGTDPELDADNFSHLQPINLDAYILGRNGFKYFQDEEYPEVEAYRLDVDDVKISIIHSFGDDYFTAWIHRNDDNDVNIPVHFVHELQHALRLMGLEEMADNFKVS